MDISSDMPDWLTLQSAEKDKIEKEEDWEKNRGFSFLGLRSKSEVLVSQGGIQIFDLLIQKLKVGPKNLHYNSVFKWFLYTLKDENQ